MAISPDGRSVAFTAFVRVNGPAMLFVRRIGSLDAAACARDGRCINRSRFRPVLVA